jgi:glycosyltransferase involved in cell wall biosynthesis
VSAHDLDPAMHTAALVTVYIPTRNRGGSTLPRALDSVWRQTWPNVEIIVVDDESEDETPELLARWAAEGRLRWFRNEKVGGACASRNVALANARGHFVTGLDDDDEMLPDRIATLVKALQREDAFVCATDIHVGTDRRENLRVSLSTIDAGSILSRNFVGNQILCERMKILECGGFDESLPAGQDYDMWIRMILRYGPARGLRVPLQRVYVTGQDRISASNRRQKGYLAVYRKHRHLMSSIARATHLYNMHKSSGKSLGTRHALAFCVPGNRLRVLSRLLSERAPWCARLVARGAETYATFIHGTGSTRHRE